MEISDTNDSKQPLTGYFLSMSEQHLPAVMSRVELIQQHRQLHY